MLERVVENWLTSVNERQYQIPFCQLLASEGETVLHISTHGQMELGIDILTMGIDGTPNAYQLKQGNIGQAEMRACEGELVELVELDPSSPSLRQASRKHRSYLVTNGVFKDTALNTINQRNRTWEPRGYGPLMPIGRNQLVSRFVAAHARYFPRDVVDTALFFDLYTEGGKSPASKDKFSRFLRTVAKPTADALSKRDIQSAAASIVLLTFYLLHRKIEAENHWAIFEYWTIAAAHLLALCDEQVNSASASYSLSLCTQGARNALHDLAEEAIGNPFLVEGHPLSDGTVIQARQTIVCGLLAALVFAGKLNATVQYPRIDAVTGLLERWLFSCQIWGESAIPFLFLSYLLMEQRGQQLKCEMAVTSLIQTITNLNGRNGVGLPNPYWDTERCLRRFMGMSKNDVEDFVSHSYTLESLLQYLARRWRRVTLRALWFKVTEVDFVRNEYPLSHQFYFWEASDAEMVTALPKRPQSWEELRNAAEQQDSFPVPASLVRQPELLAYFSLVFPHRFCPGLAAALERAVADAFL